MPRYRTDVDRWLSHENRLVRAGEEFETAFPKGPNGKAMELGETLHLVKAAPAKGGKGGSEKPDAADDDLV